LCTCPSSFHYLPPPDIYPPSLHDALPISIRRAIAASPGSNEMWQSSITTMTTRCMSRWLEATSGATSCRQAAPPTGRGGRSTAENDTIGWTAPRSTTVKSSAVRPVTGWRCPSSTVTSSCTTSTPDSNDGACGDCADDPVAVHTTTLASAITTAVGVERDMGDDPLQAGGRSLNAERKKTRRRTRYVHS